MNCEVNNEILLTCYKKNNSWIQKIISLKPFSRGCHLITSVILEKIPQLKQFYVGLLHIQILHTSASLTINESWDPDVRTDMENFLTGLVPETTFYKHNCEGSDDMPAHIKNSFLGCSLSIPISKGNLCLGKWQGIWLCEHRNNAGSRRIIITINGILTEDLK